MADTMTVEDRITHFLRLSEDPGATQAERDLAAHEAERLLAKYAIDRLDLDLEADRRRAAESVETATILVAGGRGTVALDTALGLADAARALGLYPYYRDRRAPDPWDRAVDERPHVALSVTGLASDVALVTPLLRSLQLQIALATTHWWRSEPRHRHIAKYDAHLARCDFARSFGRGAAARLTAARADAVTEAGAELVVASREARVQNWVEENLHLTAKRDRRSFSGYGRAAGYAAGYAADTAGAHPPRQPASPALDRVSMRPPRSAGPALE